MGMYKVFIQISTLSKQTLIGDVVVMCTVLVVQATVPYRVALGFNILVLRYRENNKGVKRDVRELHINGIEALVAHVGKTDAEAT